MVKRDVRQRNVQALPGVPVDGGTGFIMALEWM